MTRDDWLAVIKTMRSAPLQNMAHAEVVDKLIAKMSAEVMPKPKALPDPEPTDMKVIEQDPNRS